MTSRRQWAAKESWTIARFLLVGGATFALYLAAFEVVRMIGPEIVALTVAYVVAVAFHYLANRYFTFGARLHHRLSVAEIARYISVVIFGYLVNLAVFQVARGLLSVPTPVALLLAIAANTVATFIPARYWVFASK